MCVRTYGDGHIVEKRSVADGQSAAQVLPLDGFMSRWSFGSVNERRR